MGSENSTKVTALTIDGFTSAGGKWGLFKSTKAGLLTVRNYGTSSSVLNLWAPPGGVGHNIDRTDREATLSLVRANDSEKESEFIDIYNQDYSSCGREAGIRIQKRGKTTSYPPFKFEFSDGVTLHEAMKLIPPENSGSKPTIQINSLVSVSKNRISDVELPINDDDAASKSYVDSKSPQRCIYKLQETNSALTPIIENCFFEIKSNEAGHWSGDMKSGNYLFKMSFVMAETDTTNLNFVVLKLEHNVILCQKIWNEHFESNVVRCFLQADKNSKFSIQFRKTEDIHSEIPVDLNSLQKSSFFLEISKL